MHVVKICRAGRSRYRNASSAAACLRRSRTGVAHLHGASASALTLRPTVGGLAAVPRKVTRDHAREDTMAGTRTGILLGAVLLTLAPVSARAQWAVEAFLGTAVSAPSNLTIRQAGEPDISFTAHYATNPFKSSSAPYYGFRVSRWWGRWGAFFDDLHHKLYLTNNPPEVQEFEVTYGYNLFSRRRLSRGPLELPRRRRPGGHQPYLDHSGRIQAARWGHLRRLLLRRRAGAARRSTAASVSPGSSSCQPMSGDRSGGRASTSSTATPMCRTMRCTSFWAWGWERDGRTEE